MPENTIKKTDFDSGTLFSVCRKTPKFAVAVFSFQFSVFENLHNSKTANCKSLEKVLVSLNWGQPIEINRYLQVGLTPQKPLPASTVVLCSGTVTPRTSELGIYSRSESHSPIQPNMLHALKDWRRTFRPPRSRKTQVGKDRKLKKEQSTKTPLCATEFGHGVGKGRFQ